MKKLIKSKFSWVVVIAIVAVSVLFAVFASGGAPNNMQEITKSTTNFTQTISR